MVDTLFMLAAVAAALVGGALVMLAFVCANEPLQRPEHTMLSDILRHYYVLPYNQSEIVNHSVDEDGFIVITWTDSDTMEQHSQRFRDQKIITETRIKGLFKVYLYNNGTTVSFIALDGVPLDTKQW